MPSQSLRPEVLQFIHMLPETEFQAEPHHVLWFALPENSQGVGLYDFTISPSARHDEGFARTTMDSHKASMNRMGQQVWRALFDWSARHPTPKAKRALQLAELEDRVLFSAAPAAVVALSPSTLDPALIQTADVQPDGNANATDTTVTEPVGDSTAHAALHIVAESGPAAQRGTEALQSTSDQRLELVFVDSHVADLESLLSDLQRTVEGRDLRVILLDSNTNGVDQIADELAQHANVSAVHIVSHGDQSTVQLGNTWLSLENLGSHAPALTGWGQTLDVNADILFYGCDLAASDSGQTLLNAVSVLTGAETSASTNATGAAVLGGDWTLEFSTGTIETQNPFSQQLVEHWNHLLQAAVFQNGLNTYTGTLDTVLDSTHPTSVNGGHALTTMQIGGADGIQGLLRFNNLFGSGATQIPVDSTIESVTLTLDVVTPIPVGSIIQLHRVTAPWDANSTWNSLSGGMQVGTETRPLADILMTVTSSDAGKITLTSTGLMNTVQDWANGDANLGWLITTDSGQLLELRASENGAAAQRPQLSIQYSNVAPLLPTGELRVNPLTTGVQTTAVRDRGSHDAVATAAAGNYVVVYATPTTFSGYTEDATSYGVFAQRYSALGIAQGAAIQVNQYTASDQQWASVAMAANGDFAVTWTSSGQDGSDGGVYIRGFNADGTEKFSEQRVNTTTTGEQRNSAIAMDDNGRFVVAWDGMGSGDATDGGIFFRRYSASGNALDASEVRANSTTANTQFDAAISLGNNGTFVISWDDVVGIHARRFNYSNGSAIDAAQVTVQTETTAGNSDVAMDDNGNYVVTWRTTGLGDGSGTGIWAKRFDDATGTLKAAFAVSQTVANNQTSPSIAMDEQGNYLVVWEGTGPGDALGVFGRKFSSSDAALSPEFRINTTTSGSQSMVSVGVRNLNNFVAVWSGNGPGDTAGVYLRQFGTATPPSASLIMATFGNVSGSSVPGLTNWDAGDIIRFGEPNYQLGAGTTEGTFQWYGTANNAFTSPIAIDALHFVSRDMIIGGTSQAPFQLLAGDILYSIAADNTLTNNSPVSASDILLFRPVTPGNYTLGTIHFLLTDITSLSDPDLSGLNNIQGLTLVEQDTLVGGTLLKAGDFLFTRNGSAQENDIFWFHTADVGVGHSVGTVEKLLEGDDLGIDRHLVGLELIEATTVVGGVTLSTGTLILGAEDNMNSIAGSLNVKKSDLFTLQLSQSTLTHGTAIGTAAILFEGSDVNMISSNEAPNAFSLVSLNSQPVANDDSYTVAANGVFTSQQTWFDSNWQARQRITFNNAARAENLVDFPVLVTLDASRIDYNRTHGNGDDLRFVDGNGAELAYEIESWDPTGRSYIWVKVPQIDASSSSDFVWMYYDNAAASAGQNPAAVWTNGYVGVWHLNDALSGSSAIIDSTANDKDGVGTNLSSADRINGIAGTGLDFNGTNEYIRVASSVGDVLAITGTELTLEGWVQRNGSSAAGLTWLSRQLGTGTGESYVVGQIVGDSDQASFAAAGTVNADGAVPLSEWHYLSGVRSGSTARLYNNGQLAAQATGLTDSIATDANDVVIGGQENGATTAITELWNGYLDEIRISNVARSAAWTEAQYASMSDSLITFGQRQSYAGLQENDFDVNGDTLQVVSIDDAGTLGNVVMNANGVFTYDPGTNFESLAAGETATTSFSYRLEDGQGGSDTATVTLRIQGTNDAPILNRLDPVTFSVDANDADSAGETLGALFNSGTITDIDNGAQQGIAVVGAESIHGTWQYSVNGTDWLNLSGTAETSATLLNLNAKVRFVPNANYSGPSGSLTFRAWDQTAGNNGDAGINLVETGGETAFSAQTDRINATILGGNFAPVGVDDTYTLIEETPFASYSGWYDTAWGLRKAFTFNNSARAENLVDFPVLIELTTATFNYSEAQSQGKDLRFVDADGTVLNYEIESWNPEGSSYIWVRIPQIDASSNSDFVWMYYGNADAVDAQNATAVWGPAYDAVYHFGRDTGATGVIADSTNQFNATNVGTTFVSGAVASAQELSGGGDYINLGRNVDLLTDVSATTISAWINLANTTQSASLVAVSIHDLFDTPSNGSRARLNVENNQLQVVAGDVILVGAQTVTSTSGPLVADTWMYVTAVIDFAGDRVDLYVDGNLILSEAANFVLSTTVSSAAENAALGAAPIGNGQYLQGQLDEVRIQSVGRTANWLNAEYASMTGTLVTAGNAERIGGVLTNDTDGNDDALAVELVSGPSHAAAFVLRSNGSFDYTPANNFSGDDTFTYRVFDGIDYSANTTVTLHVGATNDPPVITTNTITVTEGATVNLSGAMLAATDPDNSATQLTYTITGLLHGVLKNAGVTVTSFTQDDINNNRIQLIHDGSNTAPSFSFSVSDGSLSTPVTAAHISFTATNDAPTISVISDQTLNEDGQTGAMTFTIGDEEAAASSLTVTAVSSNPTLVPNNSSALVLAGSGANRTLNVIPAANQSGIATITVTVSDGALTTNRTFQITVNAVDDVPVLATNNSPLISEGGFGSITNAFLRTTDIDTTASNLTYALSTAPSHGFFARTAAPATAITSFTQAEINGGLIRYVHSGDESTQDTTNFTVSDGTTVLSGIFTLNIDPVNDAPTFVNSALTISEGGTVILASSKLLTADPDTVPSELQFTATVTHGRFEFVANPGVAITSFSQAQVNAGQVRFLHDGGETAPTISMSVSDGTTSVGPQSLTVTFNSVNDFPVIQMNAALSLNEGANATIDATRLSTVDAETAATGIVYTVTSAPAHGRLALAGNLATPITSFTQAVVDAGQLVYLHDGGESTSDQFQFSVTDGTSTLNAIFGINVTPVNDAPAVITLQLNVTEGAATTLTDSDFYSSDPDHGSASRVWNITSISHGYFERISAVGTPLTMFSQSDVQGEQIRFVHDGSSSSPIIEVTLTDGSETVGPVAVNVTFDSTNDSPTISVISDQTLNEDGQTGAMTFTIGDEETAASSLTVTAVSSNPTLVPNHSSALVLAGSGANRTLNVIPAANQSGIATITVAVFDGVLTTNRTFQVTVNAVNDVPVIQVNNSLTLNEGATATLSSTHLRTVDLESSASGLTYNIITPTQHGRLALAAASGTTITTFTQADINGGRIVYIHDGSETTTDQFQFNVTDGSQSVSGAFVIQVTPVNDGPQIVAAQLTVTEGEATTLSASDLSSSDPDTGSTARIWTITSVIGGQFERVSNPGTTINSFTQSQVDAQQIRFVHDGTETVPQVVVTLTDGQSTTSPVTLNITYNAVNDVPSVSHIANQMINEDATTGPLSFVIGDAESAANTLVVSVTSSNNSLVPNTIGSLVLSGSGANRTLTVIPAANAFGTATITITVSDGRASSQTSFVVEVSAQNDAPTINSQSFSIPENSTTGTVLGTIVGNDIDSPDPLTFTILSGNGAGAFLLEPSGQLSVANAGLLNYEVQSEWVLQVEVRDAEGAIGTANITVQITNVNETPTLAAVAFTIAENASVGAPVGTVAATDPDSDAVLTYQIVGGNTANQFVMDAATGDIQVSAQGNLDAEALAHYSLTVEVRDEGGLATTAVVSITITDVNEPVTAVALATVSVAEDSSPIVRNVAMAFDDPDLNDPLSFRLLGTIPGLFSSATINANTGELYVVLAANGFGSATLVIEATDSAGHRATTAQQIDVAAVNDAPVGRDDLYEFAQGTSFSVSVESGLLANDFDLDSSTLMVEVTSQPTSGQLNWSADGSFSFATAPTFTGQVTFEYVVHDGQQNSLPVHVTMNVESAPANGAALLFATGTASSSSAPNVTPGSGVEATEAKPTITEDAGETSTAGATNETTAPTNSERSAALNSQTGGVGPGIDLSIDDETNGVRMMLVAVVGEDAFLQSRHRVVMADTLGTARDAGGIGVVNQERGSSSERDNHASVLGSIILGGTEIPIISAQRLHFLLQSEDVWKQLDEAEAAIENTGEIQNFLMNTTTVTFSTSFTIGYVLWTLRGGMLLTTFVAQMPAWRLVDPLIVLESMNAGVHNEDEESLESIVQKGSDLESPPEPSEVSPETSPV